MIKVNGKEVVYGKFPDGTINIRGDSSINNDEVIISWFYSNDTEFMAVAYLTKYYQALKNKVSLFMPYVPNARMDRVEESNDIFTMKYFGELINSLGFEKVYVVDPHSSVVPAIIKNCNILDYETSIRDFVIKAIISETKERPILFYPDAGAMKRYSKHIPDTIKQIVFGSKKRDWKTGKILGLDIFGDVEDLEGKDVLIQDDICSKGGTFYYSALALKEYGVRNIYLYVTHLEESVFQGEFGDGKCNLLNTGLIKHIYTTNSIVHRTDDIISTFDLFVLSKSEQWKYENADSENAKYRFDDDYFPNDATYRLAN